MMSIHKHLSLRNQTSSKIGQPELDGALLSPITLLLVSCGTIGSILFTTTYLIEGITRPGYSALQQAISALSVGPGGWIQQVNFIIFGLLVLCSAYGWYQALKPGAGSVWYPLFKAITGFGLIVDGFFSQDPAPGYPVGAVLVHPTLHGEIHSIFAIVTITAMALSCFVLARRFAVEPRWRGWAAYSVITGLLTIIFIAIFGSLIGHSEIAGLFERLSTGVNSILGLLLIGRLLLMARAGRNHELSEHAIVTARNKS